MHGTRAMAELHRIGAELLVEIWARKKFCPIPPRDMVVLADMRLHGIRIDKIVDSWLASS